MFACYTLRQLSNLGNHLVGIALAGLLLSKENIRALADKKPELSDGVQLLRNVDELALRAQGLDGFMLGSTLMQHQLSYMKDPRVKVLVVA